MSADVCTWTPVHGQQCLLHMTTATPSFLSPLPLGPYCAYPELLSLNPAHWSHCHTARLSGAEHNSQEHRAAHRSTTQLAEAQSSSEERSNIAGALPGNLEHETACSSTSRLANRAHLHPPVASVAVLGASGPRKSACGALLGREQQAVRRVCCCVQCGVCCCEAPWV